MIPVATMNVPPTRTIRRRARAPTSALTRNSRTDSAHGLTASSAPRTTASSGSDIVVASTGPMNGSVMIAASAPPVGVGEGTADDAGEPGARAATRSAW